MFRSFVVLAAAAFFAIASKGQSQNPPNVSQVLLYSGTIPSQPVAALSGANFTLTQFVPGIYAESAYHIDVATSSNAGTVLGNASNFTVSQSLAGLASSLNASIATALSIIPLSSPASGWISRKDPDTGAELPVSSTLGPIFTERAETIGKGRFYIGFSNQDFHFTKYNGTPTNSLSLLYGGGQGSNLALAGTPLSTVATSFAVGMDVRLSQDIAFLTYGVTDRFDVSVGLPVVHSAVEARTYSGIIYGGTGAGTPGSACWCVSTFTPGAPTAYLPNVGQAALGKTGLGDVLVRLKGTAVRKANVVIAIGGDVRLPTGDAQNYLGVGTTSVKPFVAVSFYSKPLSNGIVISPHFDAGWQFSGRSILGGQLQPTINSATATDPSGNQETVQYDSAPFTTSKGYLPDVLTWAAGTEIALGGRNTVSADILGNQVGLIHGIEDPTMTTLSNLPLPNNPYYFNTAAPSVAPIVSGLTVPSSLASFGQYTASFGDKVRIGGKLIAFVNILIRLDHNGLTAGITPMFGLGYGF